MQIYTDGSCQEKIGGWAWWNPETKEHASGIERASTNQRMELKAALEAVNTYFAQPQITIISDSRYLVNCFGERWFVRWFDNDWVTGKGQEIANRDIWEPLLELVSEHGNVKFQWVKGHSGDPGNDKADALAQAAVRRIKRKIDKANKEKTRESQESTKPATDKLQRSGKSAKSAKSKKPRNSGARKEPSTSSAQPRASRRVPSEEAVAATGNGPQ